MKHLKLRMMMAATALCILLPAANGYAQNFEWARAMGGTNSDRGLSIALDAAGNVYITGGFTGTADFNPGSGVFSLTSAGSSDIFVTKLDASGNFVWVKQMGGISWDEAFSIALDAAGNVYTTGYFQGTADFDPGTGVSDLTSAGAIDIFISKLDASGNFVWVKQMGGISWDEAFSIALDAAGNVYTTGYFEGTADFDPGPGVSDLTSAGASDIFISKLDASGNFVWVKQMGGINWDEARSIALDSAGNVYITGYFNGTADFDPGPGVSDLTSAGGNDIFISKLDASGNFGWARAMGGTGWDNGYSLTLDAAGNVYTTGFFEGTADFDPGSGVSDLTSAGGADVFISKLDASGNFVWARAMGGTGWDYSFSIALDPAGNVYTTGNFEGTADFDPGSGVSNLTSAGGGDIFVSKLDALGNFIWAKQTGGANSDVANSIAVDGTGSVYTTGYFNGTVDFDSGSGVFNLTSAGWDDIFVSKLVQGSTNIDSYASTGTGNLSAFPNPVADQLNLVMNLHQGSEILWTLTDTKGRMMMNGYARVHPGEQVLTIETGHLAAGLYIIHASVDGANTRLKIIKN